MGGTEELIRLWQNFVDGQGDKAFALNPDAERVKMLAEGVLFLEKKTGWKYCPCRIPKGNREKDLELLCPCNFKTHESWKTRNECWCSLFVKK